MAITPINDNLNIVQSLGDRPNALDGLSAAALKAKFDEAANLIKNYINTVLITELAAVTDNDSGADNIGTTSIADLDGATVQAILESLRNKLKDTTSGSTGAGFIGASSISGLTGNTVQTLLEALKTYIDLKDTDIGNSYVSKTELTTTRKLDSSANFTGSWHGISNPALADPGIAGVVQQHTAQLADIAFDVKTFGAKGDGVTDDTAAFLQWIAARTTTTIPNPNGDITIERNQNYFIPEGVYVISENLVFPARINLSGASRFNTVLLFKNGKGIKLSPSTSFSNISNLRLIGDPVTPNVFSGTAIDLTDVSNCNIDDIYINKFDVGIRMVNSYNSSLSNIRIFNGNKGIYETTSYASVGYKVIVNTMQMAFDLTDMYLINPEIESCSDVGVNVRGGTVNILNIHLENCVNGIRLNNIGYLSLKNGLLTNCTNGIVDSGSNSTGYLFVDNLTIKYVTGYHFNVSTISEYHIENITYMDGTGRITGNNVFAANDGVVKEIRYTNKGGLENYIVGQPAVNGFPVLINVADFLTGSIAAQTITAHSTVKITIAAGATYNWYNVRPDFSFNGTSTDPVNGVVYDVYGKGSNVIVRVTNVTAADISHPLLGFIINLTQKQR
ncbi:hypothetical protein BK133_00785 [Paenibacillus sp. FSL H8-0548]|uniref:glycosyl hydrolase family 28-related protein n=1 Tax=Paenibacillus sp. FSL H8-0548 TaxID=1920422 RepID=UPI00096C6192|nr:glycosyl hydrolase family 28-related protein [Paenibacillus sp. FSL H8-0548]OMF38772.1 hypothetical protein BK133_00785 [Paenibacillus sp. FSL H8-0548]